VVPGTDRRCERRAQDDHDRRAGPETFDRTELWQGHRVAEPAKTGRQSGGPLIAPSTKLAAMVSLRACPQTTESNNRKMPSPKQRGSRKFGSGYSRTTPKRDRGFADRADRQAFAPAGGFVPGE
jgi:hypothetical protein